MAARAGLIDLSQFGSIGFGVVGLRLARYRFASHSDAALRMIVSQFGASSPLVKSIAPLC
jgi:hypothetical protein